MTSVWAWIRRALGFDLFDRVAALEKRKAHNEGAIEGAINAFEQMVKDARR